MSLHLQFYVLLTAHEVGLHLLLQPVIGVSIVEWLWGGFSVDNATLNRFFSLHYLLPFAIAAGVLLHIAELHREGSNNPLGIHSKDVDKVTFYPYF